VLSPLQFSAILLLLQQQQPLALAQLDHILAVFAQALSSTKEHGADVYFPNGDSQLTQENAAKLVEVVKALAATQPDKVQQAGLAPFLQ
jgi:outer membrane protein OmpA-like peptidoglycan-associated protein